VGLLIYDLRIIDDANFKVAFHLWNEKGLLVAESFISASLGTSFHWIKVTPKKNKRTYDEVVLDPNPLTGANRVPIGSSHPNVKRPSVFGRLNSNDLCRNAISIDHDQAKNTECLNSRVNLDLNLNLHGPSSAQKSCQISRTSAARPIGLFLHPMLFSQT
jgi:hypothetical protein